MTRLDRARIVAQAVLDADREVGRWETVEGKDGPAIRVRRVDLGNGGCATVDTGYFCAEQRGEAATFDPGAIERDPEARKEFLVSVWTREAGKVMSLYRNPEGEDKLIGMRPGPWEEFFGLPRREWSPSMASKIWKLPTAA